MTASARRSTSEDARKQRRAEAAQRKRAEEAIATGRQPGVSGRPRKQPRVEEPTAPAESTFIPKHIEDLFYKITGGCSEPGDRERLQQIVEEWVTAGGNADAVQRNEDDPADVEGPTLLQLAAGDAHHIPVRVFELLLENGASVTPATKGGSPLRNGQCSVQPERV